MIRFIPRWLLSVIATLAMTLQVLHLYAFDPETVRPSLRYRTIKVERLAAMTGLTSRLATLPDSTYQLTSAKLKSPLRVKVQDSLVMDIGIKLFDEDLRATRSVIYDFIERLALEYTLTNEQKRAELLDDMDVNLTGSLLKAVQLNVADPTVSFAVDYTNRKRYDVTWQRNGSVVCNLKFPASYLLLLGYETVEGDNAIGRDLKAAHSLIKPAEEYVDSLLEKVDTLSNLYVRQGEYLRVKAVNSNLYLYCDTLGQFRPVCSSLFPTESIANLFVSQQIDNDIVLDIEIEKYNRHTEEVSIPLKQLFGFIAQNRLDSYIGTMSYERETGDIVALMELHDADCSFMHMIKIKTNQQIFDTRKGTISAQMTPFIPLQKLKYP